MTNDSTDDIDDFFTFKTEEWVAFYVDPFLPFGTILPKLYYKKQLLNDLADRTEKEKLGIDLSAWFAIRKKEARQNKKQRQVQQQRQQNLDNIEHPNNRLFKNALPFNRRIYDKIDNFHDILPTENLLAHNLYTFKSVLTKKGHLDHHNDFFHQTVPILTHITHIILQLCILENSSNNTEEKAQQDVSAMNILISF